MAAVVVKVFRGGEEVASEPIASPVTAEQAMGILRDTRAWIGKLTPANQNVALVGQQPLTAGAVYHLHLQVQSDRCTPAPVPGGVGPM